MPKFPQPRLSKFATQVISMLAMYPDEFLARNHSSVWHRALGEFQFTRFRGLQHLGRGSMTDGRPLDRAPSDWVSPRRLTRIEQWVIRGHLARWAQRPVDVAAVTAALSPAATAASLSPRPSGKSTAAMQQVVNAMSTQLVKAVDQMVLKELMQQPHFAKDVFKSATQVQVEVAEQARQHQMDAMRYQFVSAMNGGMGVINTPGA